ncbi:MAG: carboxy terminal-processing peptidase [Gammaproteobacteria bacterium]|nr:carboxy terminal-processing peptidase [Gammaproteobacteria bacterium]
MSKFNVFQRGLDARKRITDRAGKRLGFVLLAALLGYQSGIAKATLVEVPAASLTMNDELREDVYQTLYHLRYAHYLPNELNDEYSARTLDGYLDLLDPNKVYFTQQDIDKLQIYRHQIDDLLKKRDAEIAFDIFKIYRERMAQRTDLILNLIDQDFDFSLDESMDIDSEKYQWAKDQAALEKVWRQRIKNDTLQQLMAETPLDEVRENLKRRYKRQRDVTFQLKPDEVFEWFMNAYARELGPHTQYMSHVTAENFRINMSLSLEGIGAALQTEQDYTVINRIIPGGPAEVSGAISPEDKIVAVGQEGEEMINVIGWRLMDVVQMIRGDKGTKVRLQIQKNDSAPGSPPENIELVRDVIQLEDQAAKLTQVELPDGDQNKLYSVIRIPSFYSNSGQAKAGAKYNATAHDVSKLLKQVNQSKSDGLIIDLRGNGGGYLNEAITLTGLFIPQGPVVQVIQSNRKRQVLRDKDNSVAYEGPMAVLIDRYSASASEIFAAAMQDYGRAIIIGERSFGKGTVQRVAPLRYGNNVEHESQVKFTTAQFFRVNGGSTQHKGVTPDILLDSGSEDEDFGERAYDNALPWSQTKATIYDFESIPEDLVRELRRNHLARSATSPAFTLLRQSTERIAKNNEIKKLSLNMQERKAIRDQREKESLSQLNAYRAALGLEPVTAETRNDNPLPDEDEHWNMVFQTEAAKILLDQSKWSSTIVTSTDP